MDFCHVVDYPVKFLRRVDFIIHLMGGQLNAHREIHKIFARAVAVQEQLVKVLIQKNHLAQIVSAG